MSGTAEHWAGHTSDPVGDILRWAEHERSRVPGPIVELHHPRCGKVEGRECTCTPQMWQTWTCIDAEGETA